MEPIQSSPEIEIDEDRYSRQIYALGKDAMQAMQSSRVLIVGLRGLGVEVAKNLILAGIPVVGVHDNNTCELRDRCGNFYVEEEHVGTTTRVDAAFANLTELNPYCQLTKEDGIPYDKYDLIILTDAREEEINGITSEARNHGTKVIVASARGFVGRLFCDLGDKFTVTQADDIQPWTGLVDGVSNTNPCLVTLCDENSISVPDGTIVKLTHVRGTDQLNEGEFSIKKVGRITMELEGVDATEFGEYISGGYVAEVKQPATFEFKSYQEAVATPDIIEIFGNKIESSKLHKFFVSTGRFMDELGIYNFESPEQAYEMFDSLVSDTTFDIEKEEFPVFRALFMGWFTSINPTAAALGGIVAQEALKAVSRKFTPIKQFCFFEETPCMFKPTLDNLDNVRPINSRYDDLITVYGMEALTTLQNYNAFLVGTGAIGCEALKNFASCGLSCGEGKLTVTDLDVIEKSNLSRQFLFREGDIKQSKSEVGIRVAKNMNKDMNVASSTIAVGTSTEDVWNYEFWAGLDVIINALDNMKARLYTDSCALLHGKPLFESGTQGLKGSTQTVVPGKTVSYGQSQDPEDDNIAFCTLKNFPHLIAHTIEWGRDKWNQCFEKPYEVLSKWKKDGMSWLEGKGPVEIQDIMKTLGQAVEWYPKRIDDCIVYARNMFEEFFINTIKQLLHSCPADAVDEQTGMPFWTGHKRCPVVHEFDPDNETHAEFVYSCTLLQGLVYGWDVSDLTREYVLEEACKVEPKKWVPASDFVVETDEPDDNNNAPLPSMSRSEMLEVISQYPVIDVSGAAIEFEKDDELHLDFVAAIANTRGISYDIPTETKFEIRRVAGKIIPAMVTTTALVTGLSMLELLKFATGSRDIDDYQSYYIDMAISTILKFNPEEVKVEEGKLGNFSVWDYLEVDARNITLGDWIREFEAKLGGQAAMVEMDGNIVYSSWDPSNEERLAMKSKDVYELCHKKDCPRDVLIVNAMFTDSNFQELKVPPFKLRVQ
ncbi:hypothetical protein PCE1_001273 [Barthelona sp. PCE]